MADPHTKIHQGRMRREALLAIALVLFGAVILPALIYLTGSVLLGSYPGGEHVGSFYGDLFRDLGQGSGRAWILVLGPYLLVQAIRLLFLRFGEAVENAAAQTNPKDEKRSSRQPPILRERKEPTFKV